MVALRQHRHLAGRPLCANSHYSHHGGVCSATASGQRFERWSSTGRAAAHVILDILRRANKSPERYVDAASARFSHSAANAVAQLKS
jgi:hypothetical protein